MPLKVLWVGKAGPELAHNRPNPANQRPDLLRPWGFVVGGKNKNHTRKSLHEQRCKWLYLLTSQSCSLAHQRPLWEFATPATPVRKSKTWKDSSWKKGWMTHNHGATEGSLSPYRRLAKEMEEKLLWRASPPQRLVKEGRGGGRREVVGYHGLNNLF